MTTPFRYETQVFIADTTGLDTVDFARYFEWQGRARETFLRAVLPSFRKFVEAGYQFMTVKASMRYRTALRLSDPVGITVEVLAVHATGIELLLTFFRGPTEPIGVGRQHLILTDWRGKPLAMPTDLAHCLQAHGASMHDAATA